MSIERPTEDPAPSYAGQLRYPEVVPTAPPIQPPPIVDPADPPQEPPTLTLTMPASLPPAPVSPAVPAPAAVAAPLAAKPTAPVGPPTELRVHGVSGQPAEDMLDRAIIGQVAGDGNAGFFRPRSEYGGTLGPGGAQLEAYRWGNLTSGAAARALWLLLLPFTLVNVAMWLRPPATGLGRRLVHILTRVFALTMSATLTLAVVGVSLDLVAWQCPQHQECIGQHSLISGLFSGSFNPTGRRLAIAAIAPILFVGVLWFLARRTWGKYESFHLVREMPDGDGLAQPNFWDGKEQVSRLRSLHVGTMFAVIDIALLFPLIRHDQGAGAYSSGTVAGLPVSTVTRVGQALFLASAVIIALSLIALLIPPVVERVSKSRTAQIAADTLLWISLPVTALSLVYACLPRAAWTTTAALPGYATGVTSLFAGQGALLGLLLLVVLFQRHRASKLAGARGALFAGFGTPIVASLGLGLGAAFAAGLSYQIADYLGGGSISPIKLGLPSFTRVQVNTGVQPPASFQWAAVGFVLLFLAVVLAALWVLLFSRPILVRDARGETDQDFPGGRARDKTRARLIDRGIANARLTDHVPRVFASAWVVVAALGVVATVFGFLRIGPLQLFPTDTAAGKITVDLANIGTWMIGLSVILLVLLGIQTYRRPRLRRTVGILWDLATFWPRACHPLGPPCYAERVVPELVHRASWLATDQGGVVLSGHSQGSVLVAATILQMPPEARTRTALLTYGSPICRLYQRAFPTYFNDMTLNDIGAAVAGPRGQERWVNLWRATDPIGGQVGIGDRRLADPLGFEPHPGDQVAPKIQAHSGYQLVPGFNQAMDDLVGLLRQ
jgi:hypothetical protein